MRDNNERFDRSIRFFGHEGQKHLRATRVGVIGAGGLGTHVVQQLALLGVGAVIVMDPEEFDGTNRNRYVSARHDDSVPGTLKVDIAERLVASIDPDIIVTKVPFSLTSNESLNALEHATHVFGCLDHDALRLVLTEVAAAYRLPYVDAGSEILPAHPPEFGGRVCVAWSGTACLSCMNELDPEECRDANVRRERAVVYGLPLTRGQATPSVVSLNGIIASLAVTEFMVGVTGIRAPWPLLTYYGASGTVRVRTDARLGCYYCKTIRDAGDRTAVRRHVNG